VSPRLSDEEKRYLLGLARGAIVAEATGGPPPEPETRTPALSVDRGVFVTLHRGGQLRGCIGYIEGVKPLVEAVVDNALSAAFRDPRFTPVTGGEVADLEIEISALTPLRTVASWREIQIPLHGVVLTRGAHKSVFLPQVAAEQGWDRDTMLSHLAMKAGLSPDAWREGAAFEVFEAEVFAERELA
jgi:AmmeMemoRadiSam system protein A